MSHSCDRALPCHVCGRYTYAPGVSRQQRRKRERDEAKADRRANTDFYRRQIGK
jgi:hypothetical protein